jgi:hypothetical protein
MATKGSASVSARVAVTSAQRRIGTRREEASGFAQAPAVHRFAGGGARREHCDDGRQWRVGDGGDEKDGGDADLGQEHSSQGGPDDAREARGRAVE